jgi:MFS family permease
MRSRLYGHADFRRLWAAQTVSQFGSQVSQLALPLVAVLALRSSAFRVSLLGAFDMLPFLLFALPAGAWVDRIARRPVLVAADLGRAVALGSVPLAAVFAHVTFWQLCLVGFTTGTLTVFFDVAYQSYLPSLVEKTDFADANSKLELSRSGAQVGGPGAAGLLVAWITAPYAVAVDAVSFAWSALFLSRIRTSEVVDPPEEQRSLVREIKEGLRYLLNDPRWRTLAAHVSVFNFGAGIVGPLLIVYAVRRWGLGPGELGLAFTIGSLGSLAGALVAKRVSDLLGLGRALVLGGVLGSSPFLLVPLVPTSLGIPTLIGAEAVCSLGIVVFNVNGLSLYQTLVPPRMLGRMTASRRWIVWGVIPIGNVLGGVLAASIGLRTTLIVGSSITLASSSFLLARPIRLLATVDGDARAPRDGGVAAPAE